MSKKPVRGLSATMLQMRPAPEDAPETIPPAPLALAEEPPARPSAPPSAAVPAAVEARPSTQTVKVPEPEFIRLKTLSARTRRKHQDIILTALREYLDRQGA